MVVVAVVEAAARLDYTYPGVRRHLLLAVAGAAVAVGGWALLAGAHTRSQFSST